jgi:hypothetical protein
MSAQHQNREHAVKDDRRQDQGDAKLEEADRPPRYEEDQDGGQDT